MSEEIRPGDKPGELLVFDHGFVRLDEAMADDLSVVNGARVSFAAHRDVMDERDAGLIKFLMRSRHGSPFEHNSFRFHIRCPIFVAREWFRHRVGCLTGDTGISFVDATDAIPRVRSKSIDELWTMWMGGTTSHRGSRLRLGGMRLRVLDEDTNEFTTAHISEMFESGVQPVYRVTLADGKQIDATSTHRFLTDAGWKTLEEAVGFTGHGEKARATRMASFVVNGTKVCQDRVVTFTGRLVQVEKVEYVGLRPTYDLSVEAPWHNFVANGIVVHNSFNEESARYHQLEGDFYVPSPQAVRTQVGKPGAYTFEPAEETVAGDTIDTFRRIYAQLYEEYLALVGKGVAKELARSILPFGIYTQFYWTLNARSLMNFLALRNSTSAQYEIRIYAQAVERLFAERMPVTHACFEEFGRNVP
ncbi:MAG: FAD-dependent thymidylate synthase [Actinomycetota bacterium]|nr:FAD-dependent thymidylate synthase [Actinomycetota bacterium]